MSYSKGPWRVEGPSSNGNALRIFAETEYLATVGGSDQAAESIAANAKLISASPAMCEALKVALNRMEVVHWVDSVGGHGPDNVLEQEIEMVKKAIQQAEGGE